MSHGPLPNRRVHAIHDLRLDGMFELTMRCRGASVLDLGCNTGLVALEFAQCGARLVHGLDLSPGSIQTARDFFVELHVQHQFEAGDLTTGPACLAPFGDAGYDIVCLLGTYHKIKRPPSKNYIRMGARGMDAEELSELMVHLGRRTLRYFAFRGDLEDFDQVDADMATAGLHRVLFSTLSQLGPCGIWERG